MCSCLNCQRMALYPEDRSNYPPQTHYTSYFQTQSYYTSPSSHSTLLAPTSTPFEYPTASTSSYQPPVYYPNPSQPQYSFNPTGLSIPHSSSASPLISPENDWQPYTTSSQTRDDSTLYSHPHRPELATHPPRSPLRNPSFEESSVGQRSHSDPQLLMAPSDSSAPFGDRLPQRRASGGSIVEGPSSRRGSTLSTLSGYSGLPAAVVGDEGDSGPETMRNESITVSSAFPFVAYHSTDLTSCVQPFVSKLAFLLSEDNDWIRWDSKGTSFFFAQHREEFADCLAQVYRHGSAHSFIRQLNICESHLWLRVRLLNRTNSRADSSLFLFFFR